MVKIVPSVNISLTRIGAPGSVPIRVKLRDNEEVKFGRTQAAGVTGLDNDDTISAVHFKLIYMNVNLDIICLMDMEYIFLKKIEYI